MCPKLSPKTKMASCHWYRSLLFRNLNINDKAVRTWNRTWVSLRCSITFGVRTVQLSHHRHPRVCCTMLWVVQNWDSSISVSPLSSQKEQVCGSKLDLKWFDKQRKHCGTHSSRTTQESQQLIRLFVGVGSGKQEALLYPRWLWSESCAFNNIWQAPVASEDHRTSSVASWLQ